MGHRLKPLDRVILNYIIQRMLKDNRTYPTAYRDLLIDKFPGLTLEESELYFSKLAADEYITKRQGFGRHSQVQLTHKGEVFAAQGGYRRESFGGWVQNAFIAVKHNIIQIIIGIIGSVIAGYILARFLGIGV